MKFIFITLVIKIKNTSFLITKEMIRSNNIEENVLFLRKVTESCYHCILT